MVQASTYDEFFHRMSHSNPVHTFLFDYGLILSNRKERYISLASPFGDLFYILRDTIDALHDCMALRY
jgi:hypothetical protein